VMGLEKMLASMIGLTPDQLQAFISGLSGSATEAVNRLGNIEQNQLEIIAMLKELQNERTNNGDNDRPGNGDN